MQETRTLEELEAIYPDGFWTNWQQDENTFVICVMKRNVCKLVARVTYMLDFAHNFQRRRKHGDKDKSLKALKLIVTEPYKSIDTKVIKILVEIDDDPDDGPWEELYAAVSQARKEAEDNSVILKSRPVHLIKVPKYCFF